MWPMTRTIIPKQEYGPGPGAAWELAFHFYPLSVNSEEECPHPIDLRDVVREDYSGKIDRQSPD